MLLRILVCLLAVQFVSSPEAVTTVDHLTLVTVENEADTVAGEVVITEAYRRLGIEVTIKKYPGERALRTADHGEVDGEVQRIDAVKRQYEHLIQVRPAVNYLEASVFATETDFEPKDWDSLRPYRVGVIRGIKFAENSTVGTNRHLVSNNESLFTMVDRGRLDLAVTPRINGLFHVKSAGLEAIEEIGSPIERFDLYHYLHEKHADLVPRITAALEEMQANGEIEAIRRHVVEVLLDRASKGQPICDEGQTCPELYMPEHYESDK